MEGFVYKPHEKQALAHKAFLVDGYDRGTLFWGRQVGKSLWSIKHLEMAACFRQGAYFIVFNTHKHAEDVMFKQYLHTIPKELIYDINKKSLEITLNYIKGAMNLPALGWQAIQHNEHMPRSTIRLLGSDYADDHRGLKANGMIFDEYQDQDPGNWSSVYKYFFTTTKGWAAFMGTAKGYNHWWELLEWNKTNYHKAKAEGKKPRWFYLEATWRDNPAVDPEWIKAERQEAEEKGELDIFMQEVELQFRTVEGSVYDTFDRRIHVIEQNDRRIPDSPTIYVTWDFGWSEGHPTAINIVEIDTHGKWFITDEIHGTKIELDDCLEMIKMKLGSRRAVGVVCDSARPDLIEIVRQKATNELGVGLTIIPAPKHAGTGSSITSGIQLLATMIRPKIQLTGNPEPDLYVTENCKHTIYQLENYRYRENKKDRPISDLPVKKNDDHPDGLRYLKLYLKYGLNDTKNKVQYNKPKFNSYGLLTN